MNSSHLRPKVKIDLIGQRHGALVSFTSLDRVEGRAIVTVSQDTPFDEISISFEGTTSCSMEQPSLSGQIDACHRFLKLVQPMDEASYPTPRILEKNRVYIFPFTFVVPDRLLPQICAHPKCNAQIEGAHTVLPPSLTMLAGHGKALFNAYVALEICRITYFVKVTIRRKAQAHVGNGPMEALAALAKDVRIVPAVDEAPPLITSGSPLMYCIRSERVVRRGFMRGKLGRLTAAVSQPKPIELQPPNCKAEDSVIGTVVIMHLRFDPFGDSQQPPRLKMVRKKLKVSTFFGVDPWEDYPHSTELAKARTGRGAYLESVPLSSLCVASAPWTEHLAFRDDTLCLDSKQSTSPDLLCASTSAAPFTGSNKYYTTSIAIPITLPRNKAFVPTFHSCLVSRVYSLDLSISCQTPKVSFTKPTISLKVPIQITCRRRAGEVAESPYETFAQPGDIHECSHGMDPPLSNREYDASNIQDYPNPPGWHMEATRHICIETDARTVCW